METAVAAPSSSRASPAERRSRCGCRPDAPSSVRTASFPTTRGRPRSVPIEDVLAEVQRVAAAGFKEIALTGVHLGSYGRDLSAAVVPDRAAAMAFATVRTGRLSGRPRTRRAVPYQLARADGLHARDRRSRRHGRMLCAAFSFAASACEQPDAGGDAAALHDRVLPRPGRRHPRAHSSCLDRIRHHRRLSGRNR